MSEFVVLNGNRIWEEKIKRSLFIAQLSKIETIEKAKTFISKVSSDHKTATHNCWAYIVGYRAENFHSSDSGEPAGSAGRPILNSLRKHHLTNTVAVVTRYYGGVKLGIRGLIEAYGTIVEKAILMKPLHKLVRSVGFRISTGYNTIESLKYQLLNRGGKLKEFTYSDTVDFVVEIEEPNIEELEEYLIEMKNTGRLSYNLLN